MMISTPSMSTTVLTILLLGLNPITSFQPRPHFISPPSTRLYSTTTPAEPSTITPDTDSKDLLKRDRYVATNRFQVRNGKEAKFEQRWATRKSRLASLDGFRYFHLMRRVSLQDSNDPLEGEFGNYVSYTVWQEKKHFAAWRSGDAFKEAHGGTSIAAFLGTMINSALVLKGPPRPAFYDGLLFQSVRPETIPETVDGWRDVEADGENCLPAECFVACNQFFVSQENAAQFEQLWADRESKLKDCDGFVAFGMLRRDGSAKGHGTVPVEETEPTYMSTTVWRDRDAFLAWKNGSAFKQAHGAKEGEKKEDNKEQQKKPLWNKPPEPVFYEGTLVITSEEGA